MTFEEFRLATENINSGWRLLADASQELADALGTAHPLHGTVQAWSTDAALFDGFTTGQIVTVRSADTIALVTAAVDTVLQTPVMTTAGALTAVNFLTATEVAAFGAAAEPPADPSGSILGPIFASAQSASIAAAAVVEARLLDLRELVDRVNERLECIQAIEGPRATLADIALNVGDFATYPILTQPASMPSSPTNGTYGASSLTAVIDNALSGILGCRPSVADTKAIVSALNQTFQCTAVEGQSVCRLVERAAVGTTEHAISVTGAQASIYDRGKDALSGALTQLKNLQSLRTDADQEDVNSARVIVEDQFRELVAELALEGGPRVERVDDLFLLLLDPDIAPDGSVRVQLGFELIDYPGVNVTGHALLDELGSGQVGELGDALGCVRSRVNTIEEERNLTGFIILRDYIGSLYATWRELRPNFLGGTTAYLGTQLVLLQRALSVIAESAANVTRAMDSVYLGPAERRTAVVMFPPDAGSATTPPGMTVDQLLTWVQGYASEEAPRIIRSGGKRGVRTIIPTLNLLQRRVDRGTIPHPAARHPRVRVQLNELSRQLSDASRSAQLVI